MKSSANNDSSSSLASNFESFGSPAYLDDRMQQLKLEHDENLQKVQREFETQFSIKEKALLEEMENMRSKF